MIGHRNKGKEGEMRMRSRKLVGAILGIVVTCVGCSNSQETLKKIVIEEDVRVSQVKEEGYDVEVEEIKLDVPEHSEFNPVFYQDGEWYGIIVHIIGPIGEERSEFEIDGLIKDRLYRLGEGNVLKETSKELMFSPIRHNMIKYTDMKDGTMQVMETDYTKRDIPQPIPELTKVMREMELYTPRIIARHATKEKEEVYVIEEGESEKTPFLAFYNKTKDKIYKAEQELPSKLSVSYIEVLDTFIGIDTNQQAYKVIFGEDTYKLEHYLDINTYLKPSKDTKETWSISLDESKLIMVQERYLREDGYFSFHPIRELESLGVLDLETNQYDELIRLEPGKHMSMNYLGNIEAMRGTLFIINTFDVEEGYLMPQKRYFQVLKDNQLETLFEENVESEGKTLSPHVLAKVSEDGREIFLIKDQTDQIELDSVETCIRDIYKRYTFK